MRSLDLHRPAASLLLAGACVALAPAAPLRAQTAPLFHGVIRFATEAEGERGEMLFVIRGTKARMSMGTGAHRMVMITDVEAGRVTMVDNASRTYNEHDASGPDDDDEAPTVFRRTGARARVAGLDCEYYRLEMSDGMKADVCAAAGIGLFYGGTDTPWSRKGGPGAGIVKSNPDLARALREGFVPLIIKSWEDSESKPVVMTATSVERRPVELSEVSVPPGYRKVDFSRLPSGR